MLIIERTKTMSHPVPTSQPKPLICRKCKRAMEFLGTTPKPPKTHVYQVYRCATCERYGKIRANDVA